jgi:hypothetical protein
MADTPEIRPSPLGAGVRVARYAAHAVNPVERQGTPRSARDILDRLNEVSFNATLLKELRMIALLRQVADVGSGEGAQWAGMRIHLISSATIDELGASSKFNAEWDFLTMLKGEGPVLRGILPGEAWCECWQTFHPQSGRFAGTGLMRCAFRAFIGE